MNGYTYEIEVKPSLAVGNPFFHVAVVNRDGFVFLTARTQLFEAVAAGFTAARKLSRAKSFKVRVLS